MNSHKKKTACNLDFIGRRLRKRSNEVQTVLTPVVIIATFLALILVAGHVSYRLFTFVPIIAALCALGVWVKSRRVEWLFHGGSTYLAVGLFALGSVSLLWSEFFDVSFQRLIKMTPLLLAAVVSIGFCKAKNDFDFSLFRKILFVGWCIGAGVLLIDLYFPSPIYSSFRDSRFGELRPQLNRYILVLLFGYIFIVNRSSFKKSVLLAIPMAVLLSLTWSQSAQLSSILVLILWACWPLLKTKAIYLFAFGASIITIGAPWIAKWAFTNRPDTFSDFGRQAAASSRLEIWDAISNKIIQNPLWGYGLENIRVTRLDMQHIYWEPDYILHPHNYALQIWAEFGAVGVALFVGWLWWTMLKISTLSLPDQKLALSLIVFAYGINLSAYGLWQGWWLGLCMAVWSAFYVLKRPVLSQTFFNP